MERIGFVGTGAVGSTLARALDQAGFGVIAVAGRTPDRSRVLAAELDGCTALDEPQAVVDATDLVFLTVPDDAISEVCASLRWTERHAAVHCSGAHTVASLQAAAGAGAQVGACHPMQAFAGSGDVAEHLKGCMFGVEAEEPLRGTLDHLVRGIGGWSMFLRSEDKVMYHLAGVIASNYLVALAASATELLQSKGSSRDDALTGLMPILRGTVSNLDSRGLPMALTGPISRGDIGTIQTHLETLREQHPDLLSLYLELAWRTVPVALERGGLSSDRARELESLFKRFAVPE